MNSYKVKSIGFRILAILVPIIMISILVGCFVFVGAGIYYSAKKIDNVFSNPQEIGEFLGKVKKGIKEGEK